MKHLPPPRKVGWFTRFAKRIAILSGRPMTFALALLVIATWAVTGPLFGFSDTWQLVVNTGTTIVTFLMVFLIQNTQNRDTEALQVKLDELIRAVKGTDKTLLDLEELDDAELDETRERFLQQAAEARAEEDAKEQAKPSGPASEPQPARKPSRREK